MGKARASPFATGSSLNHLELLKLEESKAMFIPYALGWEESQTDLVGSTSQQGSIGETMFPTPFLWSLSHTRCPVAQSSHCARKRKSTAWILYEISVGTGIRKRGYFVLPLSATAQMQSLCGVPIPFYILPHKSHSSGPSLGTTQHHVWGSRASTSAKMRFRDRPVQLDGDGHSCPHHTDALGMQDTQDQQNPNSCPGRGGHPHFHSPFHPLMLERDQACLSCRSRLVQQSSYSLQMRSRSRLYIPSL